MSGNDDARWRELTERAEEARNAESAASARFLECHERLMAVSVAHLDALRADDRKRAAELSEQMAQFSTGVATARAALDAASEATRRACQAIEDAFTPEEREGFYNALLQENRRLGRTPVDDGSSGGAQH